MFTTEEIKAVLKTELGFTEMVILQAIRDNSLYEYPELQKKFNTTFDTLLVWGYLYQEENVWKISLKGLNLLKKIEEECKPKNEPNIKIVNKYEILYNRLKKKLKELTGKEQVKANGAYYYIPNLLDFESKLSKIEKKYKLTDFKKIERALINHIVKCHKQNFDKVTLIGYFIEKNGVSLLATEYENCDVEEKETNKTQTFDI